MNKFYHIVLVAFLLLIGVNAPAQETDDVVVHSDPRLSVLIKKKKVVMQAAAMPKPKHTAIPDAHVVVDAVHPAAVVAATTTPSLLHPATPVVPVHTPPGAIVLPTQNTQVKRETGPKLPTIVSATTVPALGAPSHPGVAPPHIVDAGEHTVAETHGSSAAVPTPANRGPMAKAPHYFREKEGKVIYSGKGYRVLVYNGPDRYKAMSIKGDFMRNNPDVRVYITYVSPGFRVKVGNYRHRADAIGMLRQANSTYEHCVIVPDIITVNTY